MTPAQRYGLRLAQQQPPVRDLVLTGIVVMLIVVFWTVAAHARWKPQYASVSPEEKAWYDRQHTTEETRKRINAPWYMVCCDDADTVKADFDKKDGRWI
jgi:regulatory protein YycH of two-component signal transduction system YycFG